MSVREVKGTPRKGRWDKRKAPGKLPGAGKHQSERPMRGSPTTRFGGRHTSTMMMGGGAHGQHGRIIAQERGNVRKNWVKAGDGGVGGGY